MIVEHQYLGITLDEIRDAQRRAIDPYIDYFKWRSEYLPFVIVAGGIVSFALIRKMRKKKKRSKK